MPLISRIFKEVESLSRLELSLSPDITDRLDEAVELLGYGSRNMLVLCIIRRFLDKYRVPEIRTR